MSSYTRQSCSDVPCLWQSDMDKGQTCIARVEGDCNKGAREREHHANVVNRVTIRTFKELPIGSTRSSTAGRHAKHRLFLKPVGKAVRHLGNLIGA